MMLMTGRPSFGIEPDVAQQELFDVPAAWRLSHEQLPVEPPPPARTWRMLTRLPASCSRTPSRRGCCRTTSHRCGSCRSTSTRPISISASRAPAGRRGTYGGSPGDRHHDQPYLLRLAVGGSDRTSFFAQLSRSRDPRRDPGGADSAAFLREAWCRITSRRAGRCRFVQPSAQVVVRRGKGCYRFRGHNLKSWRANGGLSPPCRRGLTPPRECNQERLSTTVPGNGRAHASHNRSATSDAIAEGLRQRPPPSTTPNTRCPATFCAATRWLRTSGGQCRFECLRCTWSTIAIAGHRMMFSIWGRRRPRRGDARPPSRSKWPMPEDRAVGQVCREPDRSQTASWTAASPGGSSPCGAPSARRTAGSAATQARRAGGPSGGGLPQVRGISLLSRQLDPSADGFL